MPILHTSALTQYVNDANAAPGGYADPEIVARYEPMELAFDTNIDHSLSPYSEAYFNQQMALYCEISGRELDQHDGELHSDNIGPLCHQSNPTGILDAGIVAEYVRCVSSMLTLSCLDGRPTVLDMGAGHGLGSEVLAYTGCEVHAVDIDPALGALSRERAAVRDLNFTRFDLNFDDISALTNGKCDGAFFFQALHHCLRPWKLIADLKTKLKPDGVIAFAGEPIQSLWWQHWGIRLDSVSLYVARRDGWFESGWSYDFIRACFERSGFQLTFLSGGFKGDEIGIATLTDAKRQSVIALARALGLQEIESTDSIGGDRHYRSSLGEATILCGRPAFRQMRTGPDAMVYGPYADAPAGQYEVSMLVKRNDPHSRFRRSGRLAIDIIHGLDAQLLFRTHKRGSGGNEAQLLRYHFDLNADVRRLEVRAFPSGASNWTISVPTIRRLTAE